jgi:hypothetical protein
MIGLHTSQYGLIPANVFCICINAFNRRAWLKVQKDPSELTTDASSELVAGCKRMSTSKKAATRGLINSFRIRREGRLGNSISSLAVKGVWPFAPTQTSGCMTGSTAHQDGLGLKHALQLRVGITIIVLTVVLAWR